MARRPENPQSRRRRSEGPLDWLNDQNPSDQQSGPAPEADAWRPVSPGPRADPGARPDPGADVAARPYPVPSASAAAPVLGRRAARAQREALLAQESRSGQTQQFDALRIDRAGPSAVPPAPPSPYPTAAPHPAPAPLFGSHSTPNQAPPPTRDAGVQTDRADTGLEDDNPPPSRRGRSGRRSAGGAGDSAGAGDPGSAGDAGAPGGRAEPAVRNGPRRRRVAIWLTVAALLLALWSATVFIDSGNVAVAALASIVPLVSVLALPVIAVAVASKHVVPTAIAVVAAFLPWTMVTGYAAAGPGQHTVGTDSTLRVMSIDGAEGEASAKDIVQVTRLYAVDVVVITELTSELAHELTVAGLPALAPSRWVNVPAGSVHGTGLWARPAITNLTPTSDLSRPGVDGLVEAGSSKIGISVVHLAGQPLRPGSRWRSDLATLSTRTPPGQDSFIVGDLNAGPWQPAFRKLTATKWRDAADVVGEGLRPTWPSWSPLPIVPVDHVLASANLGVVGADTTNIVGSTHRALIVTLVLPHAGG